MKLNEVLVYVRSFRVFDIPNASLRWCILSSVACVMQVMSATRADTYTNELKNTKDRQSETTSESSMIWSLKTSHKVLES